MGGHPEVRLAYTTYAHILARRGDDAALVLRQMRDVVTRPTHWGRLTADPRRIELYRLDSAEEVGVCVSLKCLPGETWVNTAYPLGLRMLLKHVRSGRLWAVEGEEAPRAENQVAAAPPAPLGAARSKRS